jgi:hypothetical protein
VISTNVDRILSKLGISTWNISAQFTHIHMSIELKKIKISTFQVRNFHSS